MLKDKTNDLLYLLSILESIEKVQLYSNDYMTLDIVIIFDVVKNKLPDFLQAVYKLTAKRLHEGILSIEELNLAVGSRYYRHINFQRLQNSNHYD